MLLRSGWCKHAATYLSRSKSASADAESPQPTQKTAANGDGRAAPAASPEPDAAVDKASAQATTLPAVDDAKPASSNASAALEAPHTANPPGQNDASEPPTAAPTTTVPSPSATNVPQSLMWRTSKPKFWPKKPVSQLSGRKIVAITVSCFITAFSRFDTVDR